MSGIKKHQTGIAWLPTLLAVIAVIAIALAAWRVYDKHHKTDSSTNNRAVGSQNAPAGWSGYQNTKYGFEFIYPNDWGAPTLTSRSLKTGNGLNISFSTSVFIDLDTENAKEPPGCASNCNTVLTKSYIQNQLASSTKFLQKGSDYYAVMVKAGGTQTLTTDSVVNLSKINISAAQLAYSVTGADSCPADQLSANSSKTCITSTNLDTVLSVLRSFQTI